MDDLRHEIVIAKDTANAIKDFVAERDRYREALELIIASAEELTEEFGEDGTHKPLEMIAHAALKAYPAPPTEES